jgi:hypothetical protein
VQSKRLRSNHNSGLRNTPCVNGAQAHAQNDQAIMCDLSLPCYLEVVALPKLKHVTKVCSGCLMVSAALNCACGSLFGRDTVKVVVKPAQCKHQTLQCTCHYSSEHGRTYKWLVQVEHHASEEVATQSQLRFLNGSDRETPSHGVSVLVSSLQSGGLHESLCLFCVCEVHNLPPPGGATMQQLDARWL